MPFKGLPRMMKIIPLKVMLNFLRLWDYKVGYPKWRFIQLQLFKDARNTTRVTTLDTKRCVIMCLNIKKNVTLGVPLDMDTLIKL